MLRRVTNGSGKLQVLVKPLPDLSDHAHVFVFLSKAFVLLQADSLLSMETNSFRAPHGGLFPKREAGWGSRGGKLPACIFNKPSLPFFGYSKKPPSRGARTPGPPRENTPPRAGGQEKTGFWK